MYAGGAEHPLRQPCRRVLAAAEAGTLAAMISAEVVQEILHRFTALRRPDLGRQMSQAALDLFAPVLPITHAVMARLPPLVERYPELAARDLVHVATCVEEGITLIVSPDRGFDRVGRPRRVDPGDPDALAALLGDTGRPAAGARP